MPATLNRRTRRASASAARKAAPRAGRGAVIERLSICESASGQFRVDRDKGIIHGAKVYGLHSPNSHGRPGVTEGTDYPIALHKASLPIFEGLTIFGDHPERRHEAGKVRSVEDAVAVIRNCRVEQDGTYADLHVNTQRELGRAMLEDAEKKLGMFALSINAMPGRERIAGGRLIIEAFDFANSVDVVTRGGTNKTLWESQENTMNTTLKAILEAWVKAKSAAHKKYAKALLEDDAMPTMADTPVATDAGAEPEDELWSGFKAAIMAIVDGDGDAAEKAKKIGKYLKAHEKLSSDSDPEPEPDEPAVEEEDDTDEGKKKKKDDADCAMKESRELRAENACLKAGIKDPSKALVKALGLMESQAERDALIAGYKPVGGAATTKPKSGAPGTKPRTDAKGQPVTEAKAPKSAEELAKLIHD